MKVTIQNYDEAIKNIGLKNLNPKQAKAHENIVRDKKDEIFDELMNDSEYAGIVKNYFKSLEVMVGKKGNKKIVNKTSKRAVRKVTKRKVPKTVKPVKKEEVDRKTAVSKPKRKTVTKTTKKKISVKPKKEDNVKYVESIDIEVSLIKRFALLHNKTKTIGQLTTLLTALKKAILQKKIRANSIFVKEIKEMEKRLLKLIDTVKKQKADEVKITIDDYQKFKEIGNSEKVIKAVTYIIRYMGLVNKPNIDTKAKNLLSHINTALDKGEIDKNYMETIKFIKSNLSNLDNNKTLLEIPQTALQGLQGLNGLSGFDGLGSLSSILSDLANPEPEMVSAQQLARMDFNDIELEPEFEEVLGRIAKSCAIMISGEPGSGKSSFALLFAKSRAEQGKRVLYITSEEGINSTMKEKIIRYKATLPNLIITTKIPDNKSSYDDIIFDSAQTLQLTPEDIRNNKNLNADLCFYVFQVTKGGVFRGAKDFEHEVDVVLKAHNGIVSSKGCKNRFGGNGEIRVY
ncbi:MAG: DNA repair protein RadA [Bacteroidales bacterium]|nr:DNA repair protein RadA [Bacteroidales bacterium]